MERSRERKARLHLNRARELLQPSFGGVDDREMFSTGGESQNKERKQLLVIHEADRKTKKSHKFQERTPQNDDFIRLILNEEDDAARLKRIRWMKETYGIDSSFATEYRHKIFRSCTMLEIASDLLHAKMVKDLLDEGANPNWVGVESGADRDEIRNHSEHAELRTQLTEDEHGEIIKYPNAVHTAKYGDEYRHSYMTIYIPAPIERAVSSALTCSMFLADDGGVVEMLLQRGADPNLVGLTTRERLLEEVPTDGANEKRVARIRATQEKRRRIYKLLVRYDMREAQILKDA